MIKWWPETLICLVGALPETVLGGITAIAIPPAVLHMVVISLLVVIGFVVLFKKNFGDEQMKETSMSWLKGCLIILLGVIVLLVVNVVSSIFRHV